MHGVSLQLEIDLVGFLGEREMEEVGIIVVLLVVFVLLLLVDE
ncbi:MAG: hypothetical protein ACOC4Z_00385 [Patescibacteria group bacterium]